MNTAPVDTKVLTGAFLLCYIGSGLEAYQD